MNKQDMLDDAAAVITDLLEVLGEHSSSCDCQLCEARNSADQWLREYDDEDF